VPLAADFPRHGLEAGGHRVDRGPVRRRAGQEWCLADHLTLVDDGSHHHPRRVKRPGLVQEDQLVRVVEEVDADVHDATGAGEPGVEREVARSDRTARRAGGCAQQHQLRIGGRARLGR
jgi:hypothetical protein